jgi:hypothetical protein
MDVEIDFEQIPCSLRQEKSAIFKQPKDRISLTN